MLNVYKCSGVVGRVDEVEGRYKYYTGLTSEATNTIAFNYLLSQINCKIVQYPFLPVDKQVEDLNDIDILAVALDGLCLLRDKPDSYDITAIGTVIAGMIASGKFEADFVDDEKRSVNLDALIAEFIDLLLADLPTVVDQTFMSWWLDAVVPYNYSEMTAADVKYYNKGIEQLTQKVGASSDEEPISIAQAVMDAGPAFLYMFIPENEVKKYNTKIRIKRNIEIDKSFDYIRKTTYRMYNDATIMDMITTGCWLEYKKSPEDQLKGVLANGGKVGLTWEFWLTLASVLISLLALLWQIIMSTMQVTYATPDGYEDGVPSEDDLESAIQRLEASENKPQKSGLSKWLLFGGIGLFLFGTNQNKNK